MRRRTAVYLLVLCVTLIIVLILRWQSQKDTVWPPHAPIEAVPTPRLERLPQLPHVSTWFNGSQASVYREPYRRTWRMGDDLEDLIIEVIENAGSSIDLAVQELNLPLVADALCRKHAEGVKVRIVLENAYNRIPSELNRRAVQRLSAHDRAKYDEFVRLADLNGDGRIDRAEALQRDAMFKLRTAAVPIVDDTEDGTKGSGIMHHKFLVVDRTVVLFGSANFTMSGVHGDFANPGTRGNANHLLKLESPELATIFEEEFDFLWGDGPGGMKDGRFGKQKPYRRERMVAIDGCPVTVQFSPTPGRLAYERTVNALIAGIIRTARRSVDMALFVFSAQEIVDALADACVAHPDLKVRGVFDAGFATRYYSETLDMWQMALMDRGKYEVSSETGVTNRPWDFARGTIGIAVLPEGDKMHHKFAVIDSEIVITGSQNWSAAANTNNDETVVIIHGEVVAAHFLREVARLSTSLHLGPTRALVRRVQERGGTLPAEPGIRADRGRSWPQAE